MLKTRRLLAAATVGSFLIGWWVATATPGPLLAADDIAYFSLARTLAGDGAAPLPPQPPYGVGYPALLAPGWLLGLSEDGMLVWARAVNALAGALLLPTLYALVRRVWPRVERGEALAAAVVGAALPALWLTSTIAWTERLLALLVALSLLALARLRDEPSFDGAALAVVAAAAMFAVHPRMGPPGVVIVISAAALVWQLGRVRAAGVVGVGASLFISAESARAKLAEAAFADSGTYDAADLASRRGLSEVPDMIQHATGAVAYLIVAGTGLAALGLWLLLKVRPLGPIALATAFAVLAIAAWFLTGVPRADAWFHGRYIEVIAPVLVAAGAVAAGRASRRLLLVAIIGLPIVAGIIGAWAGPGNNWNNARSPVMMFGVEVSGAPFGNDIFEPGAAALVAIVVGGAAVLARRKLGAAAMAGVVVIAASVGVASGLEGLDQLYEGATPGIVESTLGEDDSIDELFVDTQAVGPNVIAAMTWRLGYDRVVTALTVDTTHLLLPPGATPPPDSVLVAELPGGTLWQMPS